jgi:hypothetical protein
MQLLLPRVRSWVCSSSWLTARQGRSSAVLYGRGAFGERLPLIRTESVVSQFGDLDTILVLLDERGRAE